jgi:hypothetical protein
VAVREFDGIDDYIETATGALATSTFGTFAALVKRGGTGAWHTFLAFHDSGGTALNQFAYESSDLTALWSAGTTRTGPAAIGTADWGLVVVRKASGTATARFSLYNFTTAAWVHGDANGTNVDWTSPGTGGTVRTRWHTADLLRGRLAVRGAWNTVKWTADTTGDAALEAAGLELSLQKWVDATPDALWSFDQDSVATAVTDITGGGADQTSIAGTAVVTGDDPPGFDFTIGAVTIAPSGITSAETFGSATVTTDTTTIAPTGISSVETFGTPSVTVGAVTVTPTGITSAEAFGDTVVSSRSLIAPDGIASGEAFGGPSVTAGAITVAPTGIGSEEAFGSPTLTTGPVTVSPSGIASGETFGASTLTSEVTITPAGIASIEAAGTPTLTLGPVTISPTGIASVEAFGTPTVTDLNALLGWPPAAGAPTVATPATAGAPTVTRGAGAGPPVVHHAVSAGEPTTST